MYSMSSTWAPSMPSHTFLRNPQPARTHSAWFCTPSRHTSLLRPCRVYQVDEDTTDGTRHTNGEHTQRAQLIALLARLFRTSFPTYAAGSSHIPITPISNVPMGDPSVLTLLEHVAAGRLTPEAASAELADHATGIKALKDFAMLDTYVVVGWVSQGCTTGECTRGAHKQGVLH